MRRHVQGRVWHRRHRACVHPDPWLWSCLCPGLPRGCDACPGHSPGVSFQTRQRRRRQGFARLRFSTLLPGHACICGQFPENGSKSGLARVQGGGRLPITPNVPWPALAAWAALRPREQPAGIPPIAYFIHTRREAEGRNASHTTHVPTNVPSTCCSSWPSSLPRLPHLPTVLMTPKIPAWSSACTTMHLTRLLARDRDRGQRLTRQRPEDHDPRLRAGLAVS